MLPAGPARRLVQFGVFELDMDAAELHKQGAKVKLQDQPFKVLQILLEKPGQIVTRNELRARVWPANTFVEFDQGLYSAMTRLRDTLRDSPESPRFIETLARRGYRFIAPVTEITAITENTGIAPPDLRVEEGIPKAENRLRRFTVSVVAGLLGGALLLGVFLGFDIGGVREWPQRSSTRPVRSLAVLPLENLSGDPGQEYFVDGMTDELITDLAQLANLRVISRTSVMHYKKSQKTLPEIARELNVDAVVEGTVERSGDRVRIRVQLVRASDDRHLWAQAYDREFRDILLLQADAAREIAEQVGINVVKSGEFESRAGRSRSMKPDAYESYLKGRYYSRTGKREDLGKATTYFQQAIEQDSRAALAYSGLAGVYIFEAYFGPDRKEAAANARFAAGKALEINPDLAEPHLTMAGIAEIEWNWAEAENHLGRALDLEPNSPNAHVSHGMYLASKGRFTQAISEIQVALQLDPLSADMRAAVGFTYYLASEFDRAIEQSGKALEIDPTYDDAHANLVYSYMQKGMYDQALQEFVKFAAMRGFPPESVTAIKEAYSKAGMRGYWQKQLQLNARAQIPALDSFDLASVYAALGEKTKALDYLEKAWEEREPKMGFLNVLPEFGNLHSEPRFHELVRRVGLPTPESVPANMGSAARKRRPQRRQTAKQGFRKPQTYSVLAGLRSDPHSQDIVLPA